MSGLEFSHNILRRMYLIIMCFLQAPGSCAGAKIVGGTSSNCDATKVCNIYIIIPLHIDGN